MNNIIQLKDVLNDLKISKQLRDFINNFSSNQNLEILSNDENDIIQTYEDYLDFQHSISFYELVDLQNCNKNGIDYLEISVDLWMHSGLPDGETDKYLGRIGFKVEKLAFFLYVLSNTKYKS